MAYKQFTAMKLTTGVVKLSTISESVITQCWDSNVGGYEASKIALVNGDSLFTSATSPTYMLTNGSNFRATTPYSGAKQIYMTDSKGVQFEDGWEAQCVNNEWWIIGGIRESDGRYYIGHVIRQYNGYMVAIKRVDNPTYNNYYAKLFWDGSATDSNDVFDVNGGSSTPGGGGGDFDNTSQPVDFPDLPAFNIFSTALISAYRMNYATLHELRAFLWSPALLDNLKKFYSDPFDLIVSLNILPFEIPTAYESNIIFGNVQSDISASVVTNQFMWVDCGVVHLNEYWGAYLDYNPYTKLSIVLPYIGTRQLNIDECMGKDIHVKYMVDILTGSCVAHIKCGDSVMYTFGGTCAVQLPLSSANYSDIYATIVRGLGGATLSAVSGNVAGAGMELANTAISTVASKPQYARNGSVTSNTGFMSHQYPYLILERPRQCVPEKQNEFSGYPSFVSAKMSSLSGFNVIHSCHLENLSCTDSEKSELMNILKEGVIF